ncbi:hypothetical protein Ahia01_000894600 [Argonauta hians]
MLMFLIYLYSIPIISLAVSPFHKKFKVQSETMQADMASTLNTTWQYTTDNTTTDLMTDMASTTWQYTTDNATNPTKHMGSTINSDKKNLPMIICCIFMGVITVICLLYAIILSYAFYKCYPRPNKEKTEVPVAKQEETHHKTKYVGQAAGITQERKFSTKEAPYVIENELYSVRVDLPATVTMPSSMEKERYMRENELYSNPRGKYTADNVYLSENEADFVNSVKNDTYSTVGP